VATIANTTLPEDFVEQVLALVQDRGQTLNGDIQAAILAILKRPLTGWAQSW
jgi:hypothetical protein